MPLVIPIAVAGLVSAAGSIVRDDLLSAAVTNGLSLITSLQTASPELKSQLEEMDTEAMLKTVEALVNEVETEFTAKHTHTASEPAIDSSIDSLPQPPEKEKEKEVDGFVALPPPTAVTAATAATAAAVVTDSKSAPANAAASSATATAAAAAAAPFARRKKSSLLNCKSCTGGVGNASAIALAIDHIEETCIKIHAVLSELDGEAKLHSQRWFASYRTPGFDPLLDRLKALHSIMDKRIELLMRVLTLKSLTTQHVTAHNNTQNAAKPVTPTATVTAPAPAPSPAPAAAAVSLKPALKSALAKSNK